MYVPHAASVITFNFATKCVKLTHLHESSSEVGAARTKHRIFGRQPCRNQAKYSSFLLKNSKIISADIIVPCGNSFVTQVAKLLIR
jgi:hypothetical protein